MTQNVIFKFSLGQQVYHRNIPTFIRARTFDGLTNAYYIANGSIINEIDLSINPINLNTSDIADKLANLRARL